MTELAKKRFDRAMAGLFMSSALVIALLVGLQGRAEGKGWFVCIVFGAVAGVMFAYCAVMVLGVVVVGVATIVRRMSVYFQRR